jgi:hypothetical protein
MAEILANPNAPPSKVRRLIPSFAMEIPVTCLLVLAVPLARLRVKSKSRQLRQLGHTG